MDYSEVKKDIKRLENIVEDSVDEIKKLKNKYWMFGSDELILDSISIECNYDSWVSIKENGQKYPFHISNEDSDDSIEFSIEQAKDIIRYLQEKIDFLES